MDLSNMLNDAGDKRDESKSKRASQEMGRDARSTTMPIANGQPSTPNYPAQTHTHTPIHAPPPLLARSSTGPGLTTLHTPGQTPMGGQYPFPPSAAPAPPPPSLYRAHDSYSATTPVGRPPSHGYTWHSPSQPAPVGLPHGVHPQQHPSSVSPTPSSHHSQHTPHSVRQSPSAYSGHPGQPPYVHTSSGGHPQQQHQMSQPSTPLGPPPLIQHRSIGSHPDISSPYHHRTSSMTPNGFAAQSPAISNLVGSPDAHFRPSPSHQRRVSEYRPSLDRERERSVSVSPKSQPPARPYSSSRQSSSQDLQSAGSNRSSGQQSAPLIAQPMHHVTLPQFHHAGPAPAQSLPNLNAVPNEGQPPQQHVAHVQPPRQTPIALPQHQQPPPHPVATPAAITHDMTVAKSLKRPADEEVATQQPPLKRSMRRKYASGRPPWAVLSKHNPRYDPQQSIQVNGQTSLQQTNGQPRPPPHANGDGEAKRKPWQENPPLDHDLIHARGVLGNWEKSFRWNTPYPDMLRAVQDWLVTKLRELHDVGTDPREGTIEIEARVGVLNRSGSDTRCSLPVLSPVVIDPRANTEYSFRSAMTPQEHQALNNYLNESTQNAMAPGRVPIVYKHLFETDSFHTLSPLGLAALPKSIASRRNERHRTPRLRISRDSKTGTVLARIVKVHLDDLHIFNPQWNYDIRISLNLEVNLDRPDIDPTSLILPNNNPDAPNEPERVKDRLSYKHLAYSIDLTKVTSPGREVSFELELEVDSTLMREQMKLLMERRENAFGDLVAGFLDDVTFLVRHNG